MGIIHIETSKNLSELHEAYKIIKNYFKIK